jgi:hypothetical protein
MNMILLTTPRGKRFGRATAAVLLSAIAVVASAAGPASVPPSTQPALSHLADQIARGTPDEAAAAADEFVRQIVEPVAAVLKNLEQRSPAEQRRVLQALQRVHAALRIRLYQANLPPEDANYSTRSQPEIATCSSGCSTTTRGGDWRRSIKSRSSRVARPACWSRRGCSTGPLSLSKRL